MRVFDFRVDWWDNKQQWKACSALIMFSWLLSVSTCRNRNTWRAFVWLNLWTFASPRWETYVCPYDLDHTWFKWRNVACGDCFTVLFRQYWKMHPIQVGPLRPSHVTSSVVYLTVKKNWNEKTADEVQPNTDRIFPSFWNLIDWGYPSLLVTSPPSALSDSIQFWVAHTRFRLFFLPWSDSDDKYF